MYFEVFLEILIAAFAVFGLFSLVVLAGERLFGSDELILAIEVNEAYVAKELESYVKEARGSCFLRGRSEIVVILKKEFATDEMLLWLKQKKIRYILKD